MAKIPKAIHVAPTKDGTWAVRGQSGRGGRVFSTQAEAVKAAQASVREGGGQLYLHAGQGQPPKKSFTLGRAAMSKLNAVEGVVLTAAAKSAFKDFDRQDLSPDRRRAALRQDLPKFAAPSKAKTAGRSKSRAMTKA